MEKNLSSSTNFSKTNISTQRIHSWIGRDLIYPRKLLRGQTNSQILRYLHFSDPFTTLFDKPSSARFSLRLYYSKSLEKLYESCGTFPVGGEALSRAEPPAGPLKFRMLQFSYNDTEIWAQTADLDSSRSPREKFSQTSPLHHPKPNAFFLDLEASQRNP